MTQQRRAVVWKSRAGVWWAESCEQWHWHPGADIQWRTDSRSRLSRPFATHAEALEAALAWVGLTRQRVHLDDAGLRALAEIGLATPPEPTEAP